MNALNIMWLLNEIDCNTTVDIQTVKTTSTDWIEITSKDFHFYIDEYGVSILNYRDQPKIVEKDIEYWNLVKEWVKKYYQENF